MTTLLTKAFERASQLPEQVQDEIASVLIEEIDSELRWEQQFAKSSGMLSTMGAKALADYKAGKTREAGFDEL